MAHLVDEHKGRDHARCESAHSGDEGEEPPLAYRVHYIVHCIVHYLVHSIVHSIVQYMVHYIVHSIVQTSCIT